MPPLANSLRALLAALLLLALFPTPPATAQPRASQASGKIKVYLVGTFHFNGSESDVHKGAKTDMKDPKKQQELTDLINRLAKTKADKVFVEWKLNEQLFVDSTYALYRKNQFALRNNEVYQVGYRLARQLNRPRVYCADAAGEWNYDAAVAYAKAHGQEAIMTAGFATGQPDSVRRLMEARTGTTIGIDTREPVAEPLLTKLARINSERSLRDQMDTYLLTLARVGGGDNYSGADLGGEFYKRNLRIYTNLLRAVDVQHDKAIVLVIGYAHVAFLREQLRYSSLFEVQDVVPLLTAK